MAATERDRPGGAVAHRLRGPHLTPSRPGPRHHPRFLSPPAAARSTRLAPPARPRRILVLRADGDPVMNVHTDSALRSLDAAVATLSAGDQERARATLERIVATAPSTGAAQPAAPTPA